VLQGVSLQNAIALQGFASRVGEGFATPARLARSARGLHRRQAQPALSLQRCRENKTA